MLNIILAVWFVLSLPAVTLPSPLSYSFAVPPDLVFLSAFDQTHYACRITAHEERHLAQYRDPAWWPDLFNDLARQDMFARFRVEQDAVDYSVLVCP